MSLRRSELEDAQRVTVNIVRDLSTAVVRSNPQYQFASFADLPPATIANFADTAASTKFAGVILDAEAGVLSIKAVSPRAAALFERLRTPLVVRTVLTELLSRERDKILAGLILEGILEIEIGGAFLSRCAAYRLIIQHEEDLVGKTRLAALSVAALRHGQRLNIRNPETLAARLYFYQRLPATSQWRKLWPDANAVLQFLGVAPRGSTSAALLSCFTMSSPRLSSPLGNVQWLSWHRRERPPSRSSDAHRYKLYVSPGPEHLRQAFGEVIALLPHSAASSFKIGPHAHGLLRPDKLMVYFDRHDDLLRFAEALLPRLALLSAHGVPFSAPLDDAGILSWGIDPSHGEKGIGRYVDDSWRIWLCNRLAVALVAAANEPEAEIAPWRYALARLWLRGIDTRTWTLHESLELAADNPLGAH